MNFYEINKRLHFSRLEDKKKKNGSGIIYKIEDCDDNFDADENSDIRYFSILENKNNANEDKSSNSGSSSGDDSSDSSSTQTSVVISSDDSEEETQRSKMEEKKERLKQFENWRKNRFDEYDIIEKETEPITTANRSLAGGINDALSAGFSVNDRNELFRIKNLEDSNQDIQAVQKKMMLK